MYHQFLFILLLLVSFSNQAMQRQNSKYDNSQPQQSTPCPGKFLEKARLMATMEDTLRREIDQLTSKDNLHGIKEQLLTIQRYNPSEKDFVNDLHEQTLNNLTIKFGLNPHTQELALSLNSAGSWRWLAKNEKNLTFKKTDIF